MTFKTSSEHITLATSLALEFAETAITRDHQGGTPKKERDRLRESGLLKLIIPQKYGGIGETWLTMLRVTRELAKVDSSLAHVFSYHHIGVVIPHIFGTQSQQEYYYTKTVENNWFWCNALNPRDTRTILTQDQDRFFVNGKKSFCSGSVDSDILPLSAINETTKELIILIVPSQRKGIKINSDWDSMGQKQTDSGTIDFDNMIVYPHEIIGARYNQKSTFITIRSCITQLNLANIYLGIAEGAFLAAKNYTRNHKKSWDANVNVPEDPYILQHYGNMYIDLQAANLMIEKAANLLQESWEEEHNLTLEKRGECMLAVNSAKIMAQRVGLEITNRIFEVMGASSTNNKYGFDRYWRNMRTLTLHDPIDYRIKEVGKWALNDQLPHTRAY